MKRLIGFAFFLAVLGVPLFAEIDSGVRVDFGLDGIFITTSPMAVIEDVIGEGGTISTDTGGMSQSGFILPVGSIGIYGQMDLGDSLHLGLGFRGYTYVIVGAVWPAAYVEADLWKFTLTASVGGGLLAYHYFFLPFFSVGGFMLPELSVWYNWNSLVRVGAGVITFMEPQKFNAAYFKDYYKQLLFYASVRATVPINGFAKRRARSLAEDNS
jgi:hypothetical protein